MRLILLSTLIFTGLFSYAASTKTASNETSSDDFRCEKLLGTTLADFKSTMIENCNLNKPFSSSMSRILNDEAFFYCCHKK